MEKWQRAFLWIVTAGKKDYYYRMKGFLITVTFIVLVVFSVYLIKNKQDNQAENAPETTEETNTVENAQNTFDPRNAIYSIDGKEIALVNGISTIELSTDSSTKITTNYFGNEAKGDLNSDGNEDMAYLLTYDGGGSGTFFYVVAVLKTDVGYKITNAILLGDRIAPQTTEIRDGQLLVNYADRNKGEPMTTRPSLGVTKYLKVNSDGILAEEK